MLFPDLVLTVSELTKQIKQTLEDGFSQISVEGEISNFKAHVSGHWYFNLKDANAVISCTMWKGLNNYVFFTPQDGMKVIVNGKITVYPPRGNYQIDIRSMKPAGVGELQAAFEKLKQKLSDEGLFDKERKKEIPLFPEKIGIVTAIDGAAFRDMISVAKRRYPLAELIIAPSKVQGSGAAETIVESLERLNQRDDINVIILGRGGGSIEDLWAFNEEIVARAVFKSRIPIIAGVGHEVDFTITDFVADLRAPTPSAAMEMATPNMQEIIAFINEFSYNSTQFVSKIVLESRRKVVDLINSYGFRIPLDLIRKKSQQLDNSIYKINQNVEKIFLFNERRLSILTKAIEGHNMERPLKRGFVLVKQDTKIIPRAKNFDKNRDTLLKFYDKEIVIKSNN